jgi:hypothetical protein
LFAPLQGLSAIVFSAPMTVIAEEVVVAFSRPSKSIRYYFRINSENEKARTAFNCAD